MGRKLSTDEDIKYLTEMFNGADGGVQYVNFCVFIEDMIERSKNGDVAAETIIRILRNFTNLVRVATNVKT